MRSMIFIATQAISFVILFSLFGSSIVLANPVNLDPRYETTITRTYGICRETHPWYATSTVGGIVGTTTAVEPTTVTSTYYPYTQTIKTTVSCDANNNLFAARQPEQTTIHYTDTCSVTSTYTRTKTYTHPTLTRFVPTYTATTTTTSTVLNWFTLVTQTICA